MYLLPDGYMPPVLLLGIPSTTLVVTGAVPISYQILLNADSARFQCSLGALRLCRGAPANLWEGVNSFSNSFPLRTLKSLMVITLG